VGPRGRPVRHKASPIILNRAIGVVLAALGASMLAVNYLT